jgi:hypothetical protein
MTLQEKLHFIFNAGHFQFYNDLRRQDGEWYDRILWKRVQQPGSSYLKGCEWFGFDTMEDCVDDCLKYISRKKLIKTITD